MDVLEKSYNTLDKHPLVLFDGVCNLCNSSVDFIIRKEKGNELRFASLQSTVGQKIVANYGKDVPDSILFLNNGQLYSKSTAVLQLSKYLKFPWPLFYFLVVFPKIIRDVIYDFIARNRYKWFGVKETCRLPSDDERAKFLG